MMMYKDDDANQISKNRPVHIFAVIWEEVDSTTLVMVMHSPPCLPQRYPPATRREPAQPGPPQQAFRLKDVAVRMEAWPKRAKWRLRNTIVDESDDEQR